MEIDMVYKVNTEDYETFKRLGVLGGSTDRLIILD